MAKVQLQQWWVYICRIDLHGRTDSNQVTTTKTPSPTDASSTWPRDWECTLETSSILTGRRGRGIGLVQLI